MAQLTNKLGLEFPLLSDPGNKLAGQYGLVFDVDPALREVYLDFGIDLERFNGDSSWQLALPGRALIDSDGILRDSDFHPDHTTRPEPEETLSQIRAL